MAPRFEVVLETGSKRTFATALAWPGWSRAGRDEDAALEALFAYGPRYAAALAGAARFAAPRSVDALAVVERLPGTATTDFGAPGTPPAADARPIAKREVDRLVLILRATWTAFDHASGAAGGGRLRTGPRGGGRTVAKIRAHVLEADEAYLRSLGGNAERGARLEDVRGAFVEALAARATGDLPDVGPRGGTRWSARYAVRRAAWHALDHAWEIQDRTDGPPTTIGGR